MFSRLVYNTKFNLPYRLSARSRKKEFFRRHACFHRTPVYFVYCNVCCLSLRCYLETRRLLRALRLLTNDAHSFVQILEELNEKNYMTLANLLRHHHTSTLAAADYDALIQTWMQIAIGSEELTENFLNRMHNLAGANRSADYTSALLSNLRNYLKSYVSGILKRQDTVLQTGFGFANQTSITIDDFTLLEKLLGLHQEIHTHSFKTMNVYVDLVKRLVDIKPEST
ncbi:unnamed protein product [Dicrocoelium dendriticum]|nr:unnamed protein product [Dicrocoelium dendriticum]